MAINRFFKPVEYSYTPIPFQELMTVGKELNRQREQAEAELNANIRTFGKFVSPSAIDMENYNKESIGKLSPFLEQAAANPEVMKDAAWRASLQAQLNSIDYAKLGMLEQSANNLREGLKMRAQMEAEGLYNPNWDRSDIPNYDTLGSKEVFSDITPVKYMTANELSNKYFDNLKPGDLGPVWRDGVKYRAIGNSYQDLETIYDTYENDLINSPQGREYMRQFIAKNNGNIDAARANFREMILASQMDRTLRPNLQVDQGWLTQEKLRAARSLGDAETMHTTPTRQQQIGSDIANNVIEKVGKLPASIEKNQNMHILAAQGYVDEYEKAKANYEKTGSDEDLIFMNQMYSRAQQEVQNAQSYPIRHLMKNAFKQTAKFDLTNIPDSNSNYNREGYVAGAKSAVKSISNTTSLRNIADGGDPLLLRLGGNPQEYVLSSGAKSNVYEFENTSNFLLPESILQLATNTQPAEAKRTGMFGQNADLLFRQLLEQGRYKQVHFIPDNSNNTFQMGGPDNQSHKYISGKLRIPVEEIENSLGKGMWSTGGFMSLRLTSIVDAVKNQYSADVVKYGEDDIEYLEVDASYMLPADSDNDYWYDINQLRENSPSAGGVGGASQAEKQRIATLQSLMLQ